MTDLHDKVREWLELNDSAKTYTSEEASIIRALLAENERLAETVSKLRARPVGPDRCPFTGREFWGNITHPELGEVATYGGPFDTYTLPARTDDDEEYFVRRFDHDRGHWLLDDMEFIGLKLVDDQLYTSEDDPAELRARAEAAEARYAALCEAEPVAWRFKVGDSPDWGYSGNEADVYFYENQHWPRVEKQALIPRPSMEGKTNG